MIKKIALIICYFGHWPKWFRLFCESCRLNPELEFLFFTDCDIDKHLDYPNIKFHKFSLKEFNDLATDALGFSVEVRNCYKLCDFKPAYGLIFEKYLTEYSFWGYTDIDVIFGRVKNFISDDMLAIYDVITAKEEYLVGHFTIYKNSESNKYLFQRSGDHRRVLLTRDEIFSFDECNRLWFPLLKGIHLNAIRSNIHSMTHVVRECEARSQLKPYFGNMAIEQDELGQNNQLLDFSDKIKWSDGRIFSFRKKKEFMYFHFHFLKRTPDFLVPDWSVIPQEYWISRFGFSETIS